MWMNARIQEHKMRLEELSHVGIINPVSGLLACGDIGAGKFPEVSSVVDLIESFNPVIKKIRKSLLRPGPQLHRLIL